MKKIGLPCWSATERRTENDRPSRMFSTSYVDRLGRVAGAHEVAVQRVHLALRVDGAAGRDQRLAGDLAAEHPLRADRRADPPERRLADRVEVQHLQELVDRGLADERLDSGHCIARADAASTSEPSWCTRRVLVEPGVPGGLPATITT